MLSAGTSHIRQGMRYPSHTCRNRRHSLNPRHFQWLPSTDRASSWSLSIFHTPLGSLDNHMCMNTSSPLRHMPSGSSPLRYPVTSTSNSYSSSSHFFILQPYHTRCFFLHSSPSFVSLRRWRLLEGKVEGVEGTVEDRLLRYMHDFCSDGIMNGVEKTMYMLRCSRRQLQRALSCLCEDGQIERIGKGRYRLLM